VDADGVSYTQDSLSSDGCDQGLLLTHALRAPGGNEGRPRWRGQYPLLPGARPSPPGGRPCLWCSSACCPWSARPPRAGPRPFHRRHPPSL